MSPSTQPSSTYWFSIFVLLVMEGYHSSGQPGKFNDKPKGTVLTPIVWQACYCAPRCILWAAMTLRDKPRVEMKVWSWNVSPCFPYSLAQLAGFIGASGISISSDVSKKNKRKTIILGGCEKWDNICKCSSLISYNLKFLKKWAFLSFSCLLVLLGGKRKGQLRKSTGFAGKTDFISSPGSAI